MLTYLLIRQKCLGVIAPALFWMQLQIHFLHGQAVNQCFLNSNSNSGPSKSSVRATYKKKIQKKD